MSSSFSRLRPPVRLQRSHSVGSDRTNLSLTLTDEDLKLEESYDLTDDGDVFVKGNLAIGSKGMEVLNEQRFSFKVAYEDLEIGDVIGKGCSGIVVAAVHKPTGTPLALKVINVFDKNRRSQMMREIGTLYDANCPCLISFYGAFYREGCITMALELMDGGALSNVVAQLGSIPEVPLANMTYQILWGLAYLQHEKRVHRDLKGSNILVNSKGHVKLSDFGLATELQSSMAMCGTFVGTSRYMSPERIRNEPYNYTSDVWSLGVTLMECAMGRFPYPDTRNYIDLIHYITEGDVPTLPAGRFSPEFQSFLNDMLQKDPRRRMSPELLLGAPWLRAAGAVSIEAAVRNVKAWIEGLHGGRQ